MGKVNPKQVLLLGSLLVLIINLTACKPTDDDNSSAVIGSAPTQSFTVKEKFSNGLSVSTQYTPLKNMNYNAVLCQPIKEVNFCDEQLLKKTLLPNKTIVNIQNVDNGLEIRTSDKTNVFASKYGTLSVNTPLSESISYSYFDSNSMGEGSNTSAFHKEQLTTIPKEQAIKVCQNILEMLGINVQFDKAIVLDAETLQQQEQDPQKTAAKPEAAPKKKGKWSKSDECYALYFHQIYNQMEISKYCLRHDSPDSPVIKILYGKGGIVSIYIQGIYQAEANPIKTVKVCSPRTALEKVIKMYKSSFSFDDPIEISNISLCYAVDKLNDNSNSFIWKPVWATKIIEQKSKNISYAFVEAETEKLIS